MEDIVIQYNGFSPTEFSKHYIDALMRQVRDEAPATATMRVVISRAGDGYRGFIRISSTAKPFFAIASGPKLTAVTDQLLERIRKQLSRWKETRFTRETFRQIANNRSSIRTSVGGEL